MAATAQLTLAAPGNEKFTVQLAPARLPRRKPNAEYRSREHLTDREVERLIDAMKGNRWGHRDATMVLVAFRHGLRASELVDLRWDQVDLEHALLHVRRVKNGSPATHPLTGKELRALRRLQRDPSLRAITRHWPVSFDDLGRSRVMAFGARGNFGASVTTTAQRQRLPPRPRR